MVASAGIWPNCRSNGAVTSDAIVSALAPGSCVVTWIVGKSTCGRDATGSKEYPRIPPSIAATPSSEVAIGRNIKGDDTLMAYRSRYRRIGYDAARCPGTVAVTPAVRKRRRVAMRRGGQRFRWAAPAQFGPWGFGAAGRAGVRCPLAAAGLPALRS